MTGQTSIPVPPEDDKGGPCAWCGAPSVGTVEVEKARYHNDRGVRVEGRRAITARACKDHIDILKRQPQDGE